MPTRNSFNSVAYIPIHPDTSQHQMNEWKWEGLKIGKTRTQKEINCIFVGNLMRSCVIVLERVRWDDDDDEKKGNEQCEI